MQGDVTQENNPTSEATDDCIDENLDDDLTLSEIMPELNNDEISDTDSTPNEEDLPFMSAAFAAQVRYRNNTLTATDGETKINKSEENLNVELELTSIIIEDGANELGEQTKKEPVKDVPSKSFKRVFSLTNLQIQEPWPKDVRLFQPYEVEQILLPDNANCLAVQAFLKMCNLEFQVEPRANAEAMSPSGKVPFLKVGAFIVSELEGIVQFVNNKGISLTEELDSEQKADMRAYMSLVHSVLENAELYLCWCDSETYNEVTSVRHGSIYPWPLNHIQNYLKKHAVTKRLKALGWYDKSLEEVFTEIENCCQALTDRLGEDDYFFKNHNELDALVFGHIYSLYNCKLSEIAKIMSKQEVLLRHCFRIAKLLNLKVDSSALKSNRIGRFSFRSSFHHTHHTVT